MRHRPILAALALALAAAPAAAQQPVAALPFHSPANLIVVHATIGDSRPLWFILDTGAQRSVIDADLADSLGIPMGGAGAAVGSAGRASMRWVPRVEMRIGGAPLRVDSAVAIALSSLEPGLGHPIDGILGHQVFAQYVVDVDYDADTVRFYRPEDYRPDPAARSVPLRIANDAAMVTGEIVVGGGRIPAPLILDTGASPELVLASPFVRTHRLMERASGVVAGGSVMGVGGASRSRVGALDSLILGGFALAGPTASLSMDTVGALARTDRAGTLGAEVFRRFRVTLDYTRNRMLLRPGAAMGQPFRRGRSGVSVVSPGPGFDRLMVAVVNAGSPGEAAGLRSGDEIVAVDGRRPASLDAMRDLFREPGARYTLTVRRGAETLQLPITLTGP